MLKRLLGISLLVMALGCASSGDDSSGTGGDSGSGGSMGKDGGLSGSGGGSGESGGGGGLRTIYFDFDSDTLKSAAKNDLRHNAQVLSSNPRMRVEVQGNCDERGSAEYNLALGKRRAESARRYLMDLGVDGGRLSTVSFGEENPAVQGHNEAAWARNRRDDFKVK